MFQVGGKTGGPLSHFSGTTTPEAKRLRAILKLVAALPPRCGAPSASPTPEFQQWQALVIANQSSAVAPSLQTVAEVALTPFLHMDLERLRFSRGGKYILAQDEGSVFVLSRDPYATLFRFDADHALPADFTPDSQSIVFHTPGLHTEQWSVLGQNLLTSHEPVAHQECLQTLLSPDGRTLFCLSFRPDDWMLDLTMLDAASGEVLFQKKGFFAPTYDFAVRLALSQMTSVRAGVMPASFSADGNTLLIGPSMEKLAFDLRSRKSIPIAGGLKAPINGSYAFLGNDKVVGVNIEVARDSGVFSFPDGKRLKSIPFRPADLESVSSPDFVMSHDLPDYAVALADISAAKFVLGSQTPAMDVMDGSILNESASGGVLLRNIGDKSVPDKTVSLPLSPLSASILAATSADRHLLAVSTRTRGAVWDLRSGQQIFLSRRFNSAVFAPDNSLFIELAKFGKQDRSIVHISFSPTTPVPVAYKEDDTMRLAGGMVQEWKPGAKHGVELIAHDVRDNSVLWKKTFDSGEPAHTWNIIPGKTIFSFPIRADFAKARFKIDANLAEQASAIKNRDAGRLIQVIDNTNCKLLNELVLEVPATYEGVSGINIVGEQLYLSSEDNRTMVYVSSSAQLRQIFGYVIAADAITQRICTVNRKDEAVVHDREGHQLATFRTGTPLRFAAFQHTGGQLILLTADQEVRTVEIPRPTISSNQTANAQ